MMYLICAFIFVAAFGLLFYFKGKKKNKQVINAKKEESVTDYGIQTFNEKQEMLFSSERSNSNMTIVGYVDIDRKEGQFLVNPNDPLHHVIMADNKRFFFFQCFNSKNNNPPLCQFYPIYAGRNFDSPVDRKVIGFSWEVFTFYSSDFPLFPTPDNCAVRVYYGYY
ncbi:TPA: hypothetical protein QB112_001325 [Pasteurella multocida]|nr:hypothetical protein [Pasteurella multocida]